MSLRRPRPWWQFEPPAISLELRNRILDGVWWGLVKGCVMYSIDAFMGTRFSLNPLVVLSLYYRSILASIKDASLLVTLQNEFVESILPSTAHYACVFTMDLVVVPVIRDIRETGVFNKSVLALACGYWIAWLFLFTPEVKAMHKSLFLQFRKIDDRIIAFKTRILVSIWRYLVAVLFALGTGSASLAREMLQRCFPPAPLPSYEYKTLEDDEIRLLRIRSRGLWRRPLCELLIVPLHRAPPYEAVSYTWGTDSKSCYLNINGYQLAVTPKLYALLGSTSFFSTQFVWIDGICINQEDGKEKSQQVQMMRHIFHTASTVVVWLGAFRRASMAIRLLAEMQDLKNIQGLSGDEIYRHYLSKGNRSPEWYALIDMLKLPWFHRVWVVQEVAVASRIRVQVGSERLDWDALISALETSFNNDYMPALIHSGDLEEKYIAHDGIKHLVRMDLYRKLFRRGVLLPLAALLASSVGLESTKAHDRLYALLGIAKEGSEPEFIPDYEKTVDDVYVPVARYFLSHGGDEIVDPLFPLYYAGTGLDRNLKDLPSWVPDWSVSRNGVPTFGNGSSGNEPWHYRAGSMYGPEIELPSTGPDLRICGRAVDKIRAVVAIQPDEVPSRPGFSRLPMVQFAVYKKASALAEQLVPEPYVNGQSRSEALWRTIIADRVLTSNVRPAPPEYETYCREWLLAQETFSAAYDGSMTEMPELFDPKSARGLEKSAAIVCWTSVMRTGDVMLLGVTDGGLMGLFPAGVQIGDEVTVMLGAQSPFLLRKLGATAAEPAYELVGDCYVHGLMDGEALSHGDVDLDLEWFTLR